MHTQGFEQFIKMNKNFATPHAGEWQKQATDMYKQIAEENLEMLSGNFSRLSNQLKRLTQVRKPEDYFNVWRDCINEGIRSSIENSQHLLHSSMGYWEEYLKLWGSLREPVTATARTFNKVSKVAKTKTKKKKKK